MSPAGMSSWLPQLPQGAAHHKIGTNTMKAADGYYYDPSKVDGYLATDSAFFGVSRGAFVEAVAMRTEQAFQQMVKDIDIALHGTDES